MEKVRMLGLMNSKTVIVEFVNNMELIEDFIEKKLNSKLTLIDYLTSIDAEYTVIRLKEGSDYILLEGLNKGIPIYVEVPITEFLNKELGKTKFLESTSENLIDFLLSQAVEFRIILNKEKRKALQTYHR